MKIKEYKTDFQKSIFEFLPAMCSLPVIYLGGHIFNKNDEMNKGTFISVLTLAITIIICFFIVCLLRRRKLVISEDFIIEKGLLHKKKYLYNDIEACFYDEVQKKINFVINGKVKGLQLRRYDINNIIKELNRYLNIEKI